MAKIKIKGHSNVLSALRGFKISKDEDYGATKQAVFVGENESPRNKLIVENSRDNLKYTLTGEGYSFSTGERVLYASDGQSKAFDLNEGTYGYTRMIIREKGKKIFDFKEKYEPYENVLNAYPFYVGTPIRNGWEKIFQNDDIIVGNKGDDFLFSGAGDDFLNGKGGDDVLEVGGSSIYGSNNNTLVGGKGNDILISGSGVDIMTGGKGSDMFLIDSAGFTTIEDYEKKDFIELPDLSGLSVNVKTQSVEVINNLTGSKILEVTGFSRLPTICKPGATDQFYSSGSVPSSYIVDI